MLMKLKNDEESKVDKLIPRVKAAPDMTAVREIVLYWLEDCKNFSSIELVEFLGLLLVVLLCGFWLMLKVIEVLYWLGIRRESEDESRVGVRMICIVELEYDLERIGVILYLILLANSFSSNSA